jgi:CRP-like cAMP-binding protein
MLQTSIQNHHIQAPPAAWSSRATEQPAAKGSRPFETRITVPAGETIFSEGDAPFFFYKIITGSIRLVKAVADGHRQVCDFLLPGDMAGFSNATEHEFTAEAIQACTLIRFRRRDTDIAMKSDAALACELHALTARGLSSAYAHMVRLCHRSAHDRLAWFLLAMAERSGSGDGWIELPMTRVDIADYLGMAHETVSRAFTQLKKSGAIIEPILNRIRLVDADALQERLIAD